MKLYFMKQSAVDYIKANMQSLYVHYYRQRTNDWIYELFEDDPFELFMDVQEFSLSPYSDKKGEMDLENCKILYKNIIRISESQASDERLWSGLCHSTFYGYVRNRWNYQSIKFKTIEADASTIVSRFFFKDRYRSGFFRNTLAKYWWVGHATYQEDALNEFKILDALGADDFSTKVTDLFYSNTFASNPTIIKGICKGWRIFSDRGIKLPVREYFRPALQNMNAVGGGILLDMLSEDEIKNIFFDFVYQLYSKDKPNALKFDLESFDDLDDQVDDTADELSEEILYMRDELSQTELIDEEDEDEDDSMLKSVIGSQSAEDRADSRMLNKLMDKPKEVNYGCSVSVYRVADGKTLNYVIPKEGDTVGWFPVMKSWLGKQLNEEIVAMGKKYIIVDVGW